MEIDRELDTSGLKCPLPVLKAKKALRDMEPGATLRVISTDPSSVNDFAEYCSNSGHALMESTEDDGAFLFTIQKS